MESDRSACLTLRSAVRGLLDYTQAEIQDPAWWARWRLVVRGMLDDDHGYLLERLYERQLAILANSRLGQDNFHKIEKEVSELFYDIRGNLQPWTGERSRESRERKQEKDLKDMWKQVAGFDMDDPEARQLWEQEISKQLEQTQAAHDAAAAEEAERFNRIQQRMEEIRRKRIQQGRRR